jgi:nucleoside-diphosphate-sugar epimerase
MQKLLIIGCGDVVRRALPQLKKRWRIYVLVRRRDPALATFGVIQIIGNLDHAHTLRQLSGIAQALIHSAPPPNSGSNDQRTRRLIAALEGGRSLLQRLVYISTTGVYGDCNGEQIDETRPPAPRNARARRRVDAEQQLRRFSGGSRCRVSILRAPGIYAANRMPLDRLRKGLPLLAQNDDVFTNHIHAEDLSAACIAALRYGKRHGVYNVCDNSDIRMGDWYDKLADAFTLPRAPRLPRGEVEHVLSPAQLSFMRESRRIGNVRMKNELKLKLRYPTVEYGIRAAIKQKEEMKHVVG